MLDRELVKFYNNVRDPAWPDIQDYKDYHLLPAGIKDECNSLHNFQTRKKQIYNNDYWSNQNTKIFIHKNLAYVPVPKCASTYYATLFNDLGWKLVELKDIDIENTKFFGIIMDPLTRRLKGITEWIVESYNTLDSEVLNDNQWNVFTEIDWDQLKIDMKSKYINKLVSTVGFGDIHSMPYSIMFGNFLNKVNWIPMELFTSNQVKFSMMNFFKLCGHDIQLPINTPQLHVSSPNQLQVFDSIKQIFYSEPKHFYQFYKIYSNDLVFFHNLIDTFTPDWQHI